VIVVDRAVPAVPVIVEGKGGKPANLGEITLTVVVERGNFTGGKGRVVEPYFI
jgi:hypothetical protein